MMLYKNMLEGCCIKKRRQACQQEGKLKLKTQHQQYHQKKNKEDKG